MTEKELKDRWTTEQPVFAKWGDLIVAEITDKIAKIGRDPNEFFKIAPYPRLKAEQSLVDKALYRDKKYLDPYEEIEDKVGVRFVVLLLEDIDLVCKIIQESETWTFDACKHFNEDKQKEPLLFTYQSVHYVLRPTMGPHGDDKVIPTNTPCEVQIRTLLQHAHAELTHDAIYKSKKKVKPVVHRTVAKSMALIETTDGFFSEATKALNSGPIHDKQIVERLNGLYKSFTGLEAHNQKSSLIVWEEFEDLASDELVTEIQDKVVNNTGYAFLSDRIQAQYPRHALYQQSTVLFLYWMLMTKKQRLLKDWPFPQGILETLATDVGVSLSSEH